MPAHKLTVCICLLILALVWRCHQSDTLYSILTCDKYGLVIQDTSKNWSGNCLFSSWKYFVKWSAWFFFYENKATLKGHKSKNYVEISWRGRTDLLIKSPTFIPFASEVTLFYLLILWWVEATSISNFLHMKKIINFMFYKIITPEQDCF